MPGPRLGLRLLEDAARHPNATRMAAGASIAARLDDLGRESREGNQDEPGEDAQKNEYPAADHESGIRSHVPSIGRPERSRYPQEG
jgi:hypothetical protein